MFPPGLEPGTFRVLGERDNHYTTETWKTVVLLSTWIARGNLIHLLKFVIIYDS